MELDYVDLGRVRGTCRAIDEHVRLDPRLPLRARHTLARACDAAAHASNAEAGARAAEEVFVEHFRAVPPRLAMRDALTYWKWQAQHATHRSLEGVARLWWQLTPVLAAALSRACPSYARVIAACGAKHRDEEVRTLRRLPWLADVSSAVRSDIFTVLGEAAATQQDMLCSIAHLRTLFSAADVEQSFGPTPYAQARATAFTLATDWLVQLAPSAGSNGTGRVVTFVEGALHAGAEARLHALQGAQPFAEATAILLQARPAPNGSANWPDQLVFGGLAPFAGWRKAWHPPLLRHLAHALDDRQVELLTQHAPATEPAMARASARYAWEVRAGLSWPMGQAAATRYVRVDAQLCSKVFLFHLVPRAWWRQLFPTPARGDSMDEQDGFYRRIPLDLHGQLWLHREIWSLFGGAFALQLDAYARSHHLVMTPLDADDVLLRPERYGLCYRELTLLALADKARPKGLSPSFLPGRGRAA